MGVVAEDINAFRSPGGLQFGCVDAVTVVSAVTMPAPRAYITTISGTAALSLIPLPWPGFTGDIKFIPTAAFTGVTGGTPTSVNKPIGLAFTAVVGKVLTLTYDGSKWWPSY